MGDVCALYGDWSYVFDCVSDRTVWMGFFQESLMWECDGVAAGSGQVLVNAIYILAISDPIWSPILSLPTLS